MATIGSLAVKLLLQAGSFSKGVAKAGSDLVGLSKVADYASTGLAAVGGATVAAGAAAVAGGVGFAYWQKSVFDNVAGQQKLARQLGTTQGAISGLQEGVRALGGDQDAVAGGLQNLREALVDASSGGAATADTFARLGLSVSDLKKMDPADAFAKIAGAIAALPPGTKQAAAATAIFKDKAKDLLPLLAQGEAGIAAAAAEAKRLGLSLSDIQANQVEDAATAVDGLGGYLKGAGMQIAANLAPHIIALIDQLNATGIKAADVGSIILTGMEYAAKGVGFVIAAFYGWQMIIKFVELGFMGMVQSIAKGIRELLKVAGKLPDKLGGAEFRDAANKVGDGLQGLDIDMKRVMREIDEIVGRKDPVEAVGEAFDKIREAAKGAAAQAKDLKGANGGVADAAANLKLFQEGSKVFDSVRTPVQSFGDDMAKLNALLEAGAIGFDTYAKAAAGALDKLEQAQGLKEIHLPAALTRDSAAARSAITMAEQQRDRQREKPEDRIKRVLDQALEVQKEQLKQQRKIGDALRNQPLPVNL